MASSDTRSVPAPYANWVIPALDPAAIATAPGVQLLPHGGQLMVHPRPITSGAAAAAFAPFPLPVVPGPLVNAMAYLCRLAERRVSTGGAFLMYLDPLDQTWSAACPAPQPALGDPSVKQLLAKLTAEHTPLLVDPRRRPEHVPLLAGGYLASPTADAKMVAQQVPDVDGLWLFHQAGSWGHIGPFTRVNGRLYTMNPLDVTCDYDAAGELHPHDRPWIPSPI